MKAPKSVLQKFRFARYRRNTRGATAVEFGAVFPIFMTFMMITVESGLIMFREYAIQSGVQRVSRAIRTGAAQNGSWDVAKFRTEICNAAAVLGSSCPSMLKIYIQANTSFANIKSTAPAMMTIGPDSTGADKNVQFNCGSAKQVVAVMATFDHKFMMPGMNLLWANTTSNKRRRLSAFTMFRNEPFPTPTSNCTSS